eukprot:2348882-Rhodomonas_salina.2
MGMCGYQAAVMLVTELGGAMPGFTTLQSDCLYPVRVCYAMCGTEIGCAERRSKVSLLYGAHPKARSGRTLRNQTDKHAVCSMHTTPSSLRPRPAVTRWRQGCG